MSPKYTYASSLVNLPATSHPIPTPQGCDNELCSLGSSLRWKDILIISPQISPQMKFMTWARHSSSPNNVFCVTLKDGSNQYKGE